MPAKIAVKFSLEISLGGGSGSGPKGRSIGVNIERGDNCAGVSAAKVLVFTFFMFVPTDPSLLLAAMLDHVLAVA
jgi:hypothetical protein